MTSRAMGTSVMGFRDAQRAYDIELPDVPGVTALALRSVLNVVALATDDENQQTFVSHSTISKRSGAAKRTVTRALDVLECLDLIRREKRYRANGAQSADLIELRLSPGVTTTSPRSHGDTGPVVTLTTGGSHDDYGGMSPQHGGRSHGDTGNGIIQKDHPTGHPDNHSERAREDRFEEYWQAAPKRAKRPAALTAWKTAVRNHDPDEIIAGALRWRDDPLLVEHRWIPEPANWLRDERWRDEPPHRELTRSEQNVAVVAAIEANDRREEVRGGYLFVNGKPKIGGPDGMTPDQYHVWIDWSVERDGTPCPFGTHKLAADGTCAICPTSAEDIATETAGNA